MNTISIAHVLTGHTKSQQYSRNKTKNNVDIHS